MKQASIWPPTFRREVLKWAGLTPLRPRGLQSLQSALPGLCRNPGCPPSRSTLPVSVNPWVLGWGRYTQRLHTNSGACVGLCFNNMISTTDSFRLIKELGKTSPTPAAEHRLQLRPALRHTYGSREKALSVAPSAFG